VQTIKRPSVARKTVLSVSLDALLKQAKEELMADSPKKPNLSELLAAGTTKKKESAVDFKGPYEPQDDKSANYKVYQMWKMKYVQFVGLGYVMGKGEMAMLKGVIKEYGHEDTNTAILYYFENWKNLSYLNGYPTMKHFVGFRRTIFGEALVGKVTGKAGQFTGREDTVKWKD